MIEWQIGCSGFHYKHWKGTFYPEDLPQTRWFSYYTQFFNTLELNVTFYRFPRLPALQSWYNISPPEFKFAVKAPRAITHYRKFLNVGKFLTDFYRTVGDGLQEKLGCALFQLPSSFSYTSERLDRIISSLDNSFSNVLEFRDPSWWNREAYDRLGNKNITFCGISHPSLPNEVVINAPLVYYRFHGDEQLYASRYRLETLEQLSAQISHQQEVRKAFIFFNNDINANAVYNGQEMQGLINTIA